jgi:integrase
MNIVIPESMKLSRFLRDSLTRIRGQVRENTLREHEFAMNHFIEVIGNIDYLKVTHSHGERFLQACQDKGNSVATAAKKLRHLKRLFQLAVDRRQMDENPLRNVKKPKSPEQEVHTFTDDECARLIRAAREWKVGAPVPWDLLIIVSLATAMRRGELLNTTWSDIDFGAKTIKVTPKKDTDETWE